MTQIHNIYIYIGVHSNPFARMQFAEHFVASSKNSSIYIYALLGCNGGNFAGAAGLTFASNESFSYKTIFCLFIYLFDFNFNFDSLQDFKSISSDLSF